MSIYVPGQGNPRAKLMLVGEAPGRVEEQQGHPFAGPTGKIVDDLIRGAGLSRSELYLTNVVKVRPPDNKIPRLKETGHSVEEFTPQLWREIKEINPNCILAIGDLSLQVLTGNHGIKKWRGSILPSVIGYPKIVPTIHPASILHGESMTGGMMSWSDLVYIQEDFKRAAEESKTKELNLPDRLLTIARNELDLYRFLERNKSNLFVSYDIEAYKTVPTCISLAFSRFEAISMPLINMSPEFPVQMHDLKAIWRTLIEFISDMRIKTIGQNLKYDQVRLFHSKLRFPDPYFDVMLAFHTIYPELPRSLQFIQSLLTREPYHKDEYKEYDPKKDKPERIYLYNAKDAVVEFECYEVLSQELRELGLESFFYDHVMPLHNLYRDLEETGILIDKDRRKELNKKFTALIEGNADELTALIGSPVNVNSPKQVHILLFGELGIPMRKDVGEETLQSLLNNVVKDARKRKIIELILRGRKLTKTRSTYIEAETSSDGRMRTSVNIAGPETGRSSNSKRKPPVSLEPEGLPFQVLTKHGEIGPEIRSMFVPDKDMVFFEIDYSQAEARIAALLADDDFTLKMFKLYDDTHKPEYDIHRITASWINNMKPEDIPKDHPDRQIGKGARYLGQYDGGKHRLALQANCSEYRAGKALEAFHKNSPRIRQVFHKEIQEQLAKNRVLRNPFGRYREFYNKWGDDLFKEAYAHIPQSTVPDALRVAMRRVKKYFPACPFIIESHDSFTALVHKLWLKSFAVCAKESLEVPIDFTRCSLSRGKLVIPAEAKIGEKNLQEMVEYKF